MTTYTRPERSHPELDALHPGMRARRRVMSVTRQMAGHCSAARWPLTLGAGVWPGGPP